MSENKPVYVKRLLPSSVGESVSHPAAAIRSSRIFQENITMNDGGYSAKNGAREAPVHRLASSGAQLGDDFPMLCETCLGPNPYVRMTKLPYGYKLCKISNLPFQAFKWKAGPGGRYKETMVSFAVAAERNICQTCLLDMKYGLPVGVRDTLLGQAENKVALPQSDVGQQYYYENQQALVESGQGGQDLSVDLANVVASRQLDRFSRAMHGAEGGRGKTAFRNLPKLCSFWMSGLCTRVLNKTCPFRPCCGEFVFPEIAGSHKELCARLVEALKADGPAVVMKSLDNETRSAIQEAMKGNRDEAMRKRVNGSDDLTRKYLGKMKKMDLQLEPPADKSIVTLWLGNVEGDLTEADIRAVIYPYGQIASFHIVRSARCAFVEYVDREAAEGAAGQLYNNLVVNGQTLSVNWAKPRAQGDGSAATAPKPSNVMLPPPGMERAPPAAYVLPGMPAPVTSWPPTEGGATGEEEASVPASTEESSKKRPLESSAPQNASNRPKFTPAPPRGPPPTSVGLLAGLSSYGDDDEDENEHTTTSVAPASQTKSAATGKQQRAGVQYPSMNPTRMGASI